MKFKLIEQIEITDYEKQIGHELEVNERKMPSVKEHGLPKYYVTFENSDLMGDGILMGAAGNGNTIDEALIDYCNQISGKRMVFNACTKNRAIIDIPHLIHTKLLNK